MQIQYKHAKPGDIHRAQSLMELDRALYSDELWRRLPVLLIDLMRRERIRICVYDDLDSGEMVCFGVTTFVRPGVLEEALERGVGLAETVLAAEQSQRPALLNHKQVAEANRRGDLRALTLFGVLHGSDISDPDVRDIVAPIMAGWTFLYRGFSLREIWFEPVTHLVTQSMEKTRLPLLRERRLAGGQTARVFRLNREEAEALMPHWPAWLMFTTPPRFGFTRTEQQLLELALLDYSDRDAAEWLRVSGDAIKKRWRSIYGRVERIDPGIFGEDSKGSDQRRDLLQRLRNNLQEIRPY